MVFNSLEFIVFIALFFPIFFALKGKAQLLWSLVASYFFYGWWDWRFLFLIVFSTCMDFSLGLLLDKSPDDATRKKVLYLSVILNLGFLGFFKYFNFFIDSFQKAFTFFGFEPSLSTLNIILPVGISFYTFQSMSYTIDVYRKSLPVEKDFIRFATFVVFFPQLVAGPIVRASECLPQFNTSKTFDWHRLNTGLGQVLWGFFKKMAIADSIAPFVDQCFAAPEAFSSMHLLIGVVFYSFQIYCDFSGYSDIAIGLAHILGYEFPTNFKTPYFSKNFSEFWTRWHITLSGWLRDYLYIPLGGNRNGTFQTYRNLMLTMLLGGLWHGASWVFIFWGFLHGSYLVAQRLWGASFGKFLSLLGLPKVAKDVINVLLVYAFTCLAWIFFRSPDFPTALQVISGIGSLENFNFGSVINKFWVIKGALLIGILLLVELSNFRFSYLQLADRQPMFRVASYAVLLWLIAFFGTFGAKSFIYFQF